MTSPHGNLASVAERLVANHGRSVTLRKHAVSPDDAGEPFYGATSASDTTTTAVAVFVRPEDIRGDREVGQAEKLALVAASAHTAELETYDEIDDADGERWRITRASLLAPGSTRILYEFELGAIR